MTLHGYERASRREPAFVYSAYVLIVHRTTSRAPRHARGIPGIVNGSTRE